MENTSSKIRQLREEKGLTQQELADMVGYKSRASINKIELERDIPYKKLVPIAKALDVSPVDLISDDGGGADLDIDKLKLFEKYDSLTDEQRKLVMDVVDAFIDKNNKNVG